jgi:O-antigen ligase
LIWLSLLLKSFGGMLPKMPGSMVPIVQVKSGDSLAHIAGVGAFIIVGMARAHPAVVGLLMLAFIQGNRAGMLACMAGLLVAVLLTPFKAKMARFIYVMSCALVALAFFMPTITIGRKTVSMEELWEKTESIFVESSVSNYNNTKTWRLDWWNKIIDYTVYGPYFWTGKGYGINLSLDDGFLSGAGEKLRSPHNSHMSVLARSGVPGFLLWVILHVGWIWGMMRHYVRSRSVGDIAWAGVFAFLMAYYTAIMVNACFDVVLESPMGGIWMWILFGTGIAAMHLHTHHPDVITLT